MATPQEIVQQLIQGLLPQPTQGPLIPQQVQPQPQPVAQPQQPQQQTAPQPPPQMPGVPLGQYANGNNGGFKSKLGDFLKNTLAEIVPAATQVAIWGPGEFGQRMAFNKLTSHLAKKKEDEEKERQDIISQMATAHVGMRKYLKSTNGDPDMYYQALTVPGTSTGNPQVDAWLQQLQPQLDQLRKAGKLDATSMLSSFEKSKEYEDLTKEENMTEMELYQKDPEKYKEYKEAGRTPRQSKLLTDEELNQKITLADKEAAARAKYRKPDKPEKPDKVRYQETWIYNPDGTKRVPARFNPLTGVKEPLAKEWQKVPTGSKNQDSPNPLKGMPSGKYEVNGKVVKWDGQKEIQ